MALNKEQWSADIQENRFKNNAILSRAVNHDLWITNKTVHIPQAGANPSVTKNRTSFPASIAQRTDTDLTYDVNAYYLDPIMIEKAQEAHFISYDKRMSVMGQQLSTMEEYITNNVLYAWAPSGSATQVRTTGSADGLALAPSATGTRKAITLADIQKAKAILDAANIPQEGRVLLMQSDIYNSHFLSISNIAQAYAFGQAVLPTGVVGRIMGFDVMIRSTVVVFDNTGTPVIKTVGDNGVPTSPTTSDNMACLAYHPNYVCRAIGSVDVSVSEDAPGYYGASIIESVQHLGAAKLRTDQAGIVAIIQAA